MTYLAGDIDHPEDYAEVHSPEYVWPGARIIGIKTEIAEHLCRQGAVSSPFLAPDLDGDAAYWRKRAQKALALHDSRKPCSATLDDLSCVRESGHAGCHAYDAKEPRDHSALTAHEQHLVAEHKRLSAEKPAEPEREPDHVAAARKALTPPKP